MTPQLRLKNRQLAVAALGIVACMALLVVYAPTLYEKFCEITGYGGFITEAVVARPAAATAAGQQVTVRFDANVAPGLPWKFYPEKATIRAKFGETITTHYVAENTSTETMVGRAVFNVTPFKAASFFYKTECFCFTEQRLEPGQKAEMPLVLYVDESLLRDKHANDVKEITLSYTFLRSSGERAEESEDLVAGSEARRKKLESGEELEFLNDAPRR